MPKRGALDEAGYAHLVSLAPDWTAVGPALMRRMVADVATAIVPPEVHDAIEAGVATIATQVAADGTTAWTVRSLDSAATVLLNCQLSRARAAEVRNSELFALAAVAVGAGRHALAVGRDRAWSRRVGGRLLIERQSTAHRLAHAAARVALVGASLEATFLEMGLGMPVPEGSAVAAAAVTAAATAVDAMAQVYGAASTSDEAPVRAAMFCQSLAELIGAPIVLWNEAGRLHRERARGLRASGIEDLA